MNFVPCKQKALDANASFRPVPSLFRYGPSVFSGYGIYLSNAIEGGVSSQAGRPAVECET
jgi:hypothetical protein